MLKVREDHVRSVLEEARRRLGEVTKDSTKYSEVSLALITQGLFQIMEPKATIRCRQTDVGMIEQILPKALQDYKAKIGKDTVITMDKENFLAADTCGGIELLALNGRLRVSIPANQFFCQCLLFCILMNEIVFFFQLRCQTHWKHVWN